MFFMQISSVARSAGRRATAAAALSCRRAPARRAQRRADQLRAPPGRAAYEIFCRDSSTAAGLVGRNRQKLWNTGACESAHARVAREYQVSLPAELNAGQRIALARAFPDTWRSATSSRGSRGTRAPSRRRPAQFPRPPVDHDPRGDACGLGAKAGLDLQALERRPARVARSPPGVPHPEGAVGTLVTRRCVANVAARVDHRSLAAQGIDRAATENPLSS